MFREARFVAAGLLGVLGVAGAWGCVLRGGREYLIARIMGGVCGQI